MHRRSFLQLALAGTVGSLLSRPAWAAPAASAQHLIVLWMNGGPSHIDTWDPKAGKDGTRHKIIKTKTKGLTVAEHLPLLAGMSDRFTVLHGLSAREGNHQRAEYLMHTGYSPNPTIVHPSLGGWLSKLGQSPPAQGLPSFVSLGGTSFSAGFLGVEHGPFVLPKSGVTPANTAPPPAVADREAARLELLGQAEAEFLARTGGDPKVADRRQQYEKATALMHSPQLAAFDVSQEPGATRKAFGDTEFGRGCLAAVRLVQAGVRCIEVTLDGWDTHTDLVTRTKSLMQTLDPAMSSLLAELAARQLLDQTVVVWMGDFGRTPKLNANEGRDHHPQSSSVVLAGGGLRRGLVYGETDATGDQVVKDAITVPNLMATITSRLGLDPTQMLVTPIGRPIGVTDHGAPVAALIA